MKAYVVGVQKSKFDNIYIREFDCSEPDRYIESRIYFHPVGYLDAFTALFV